MIAAIGAVVTCRDGPRGATVTSAVAPTARTSPFTVVPPLGVIRMLSAGRPVPSIVSAKGAVPIRNTSFSEGEQALLRQLKLAIK